METISKLFKVALFALFPVFVYSQEMDPEKITINNNGVILQGRFYEANQQENSPTVIMLNGFPATEVDELGLCKRMSQSGINVMTFHYSGTNHSQGEWSWDNTQSDIQAAVDFLFQKEKISKFKIDTSCFILGGYSYGGGMALSYAANHTKIQNVFSIAGTDHVAFMKEYNRNLEMKTWVDDWFASLKAPDGPVRIAAGASPKEIAEKGIDRLDPAYSLIGSAPLLASRNILLIGGWGDMGNSVERMQLPLYRALKKQNAQNVTITAFQDNHAFQNSREDLADVIISWITVSEAK